MSEALNKHKITLAARDHGDVDVTVDLSNEELIGIQKLAEKLQKNNGWEIKISQIGF